jgi:hypothetical protein
VQACATGELPKTSGTVVMGATAITAAAAPITIAFLISCDPICVCSSQLLRPLMSPLD